MHTYTKMYAIKIMKKIEKRGVSLILARSF